MAHFGLKAAILGLAALVAAPAEAGDRETFARWMLIHPSSAQGQVVQIGHGNDAGLHQSGGGSRARVTQVGAGHRARVRQRGPRNGLGLIQTGTATDVTVYQNGYGPGVYYMTEGM